nr:trans-resveratrol di-O-methyltransferase-like [Ipomoea batatas]
MHAVYIINRLPSPVIECSSPYQWLYGEMPDISNLKVFGCLCYAATLSGNRHKMAPRGRKCLFIGIPAGIKGYMLYDLGDGSIFVSRDVTFYEEEFPMAADISQSQSQQGPPLPNIPTHPELELYEQKQPLKQPRHVEQTSTEQQGPVHEQPHGNITPITDLVESQQVQNSEPTSTSQPDVNDQEKSCYALGDWFQNDDPSPFCTAHWEKIWDYISHEPGYNDVFNEATAKDSELIMEVLLNGESKRVFDGLKSLVDVAGGKGAVASAIAKCFPAMKCIVLDLPHVIASVPARSIENMEFVAGNMFENIPAANAVLLKRFGTTDLGRQIFPLLSSIVALYGLVLRRVKEDDEALN